MIELTSKPIDSQPVIDAVKGDSVAVFVGTVRNSTEGKRVLRLEYDAYPQMAIKTLKQIADEASVRWPGVDIAVIHRYGTLEIGETAVVIAAGSASYESSFSACEYVIDRIKDIVPIWKKEVFEDGYSWVGHP